jgi:hypothetical protein
MSRETARRIARSLDVIARKPGGADGADLSFISDFYYRLSAADARKVFRYTTAFPS